MAPSTRRPPARQPLQSHFRAQKRGTPTIEDGSRLGQKGLTKGKAAAVDAADTMPETSNGALGDIAPSRSSAIDLARPSTPPPRHAPAAQPGSSDRHATTITPRTPPRTPVPRSRTATLPDIDLLEPLQRSPVSVRTDPESGKMYLMLPGKSSPSMSPHARFQRFQQHDDTQADAEPSSKRRRRTESQESMLTPGRHIDTRTARLRQVSSHDGQGEEDDLAIICTPKQIRERPSGAPIPPFATPTKPAVFPVAQGTPDKHKTKKRRTGEAIVLEDGTDNPFVVNESRVPVARPDAAQYIYPIDSTRLAPPLQGSRSLPLPTLHATLFALHAALEHALVVHLATAGTSGSAIQERMTGTAKPKSVLAIPELISLSALRPLVERSSGRRFGKQELARLMWIWGGTEASRWRSNVGLTITRTRTLDKSGKRVQDYALGIELHGDAGQDEWESDDEEYVMDGKQDGDPHTPPSSIKTRALGIGEPQSPSPSPRITRTPGGAGRIATPPQSPSMQRTGRHARTTSAGGLDDMLAHSPSSSLYARRGISLVALWNNGLEHRKRLVRRRLLRWCLDCYAAWQLEHGQLQTQAVDRPHSPASTTSAHTGLGILAEAEGSSLPTTPRRLQSHAVEDGQGGLMTPASTREQGWIPGKNRIKDHFAVLDEKTEKDERMPGAAASTYVLEWDPAFPLEQIAPTPMVALPTLEGPLAVSTPIHTPHSSRLDAARKAHKNAVAQSEETLGRKLTLAERIRAKEEAAAAAKKGGQGAGIGSHGAGTQGSTSAQAVAAAARKRSSLSRLQDVAESIYMLFVSSNAATALPASARTPIRFTPLPLNDVLRAICNASRTALSATDAQSCLDQLQAIAPGFVEVDKVGMRHWVKLVGRVDEMDSATMSVVAAAPAPSAGATPRPDGLPSTSILAAVRRCVRAELQRLEANEA